MALLGLRVAAACSVGVLLLSGCSEGSTSGAGSAPSDDATATSTDPSAAGSSGAPSATTTVEAAPAQVDWTIIDGWPRGEDPEGATPAYTVSRSADRRTVLVRDAEARDVLLTSRAPDGFEVGDVFLDAPSLVVVHADPAEERDDRVTIVDLRTGRERGLAPSAPQPWMGNWSLGEGVVTYGARGPAGKYCLATVRLDTLDGDLVDCVPPRQGINEVRQSPFGLGYTTFDDARPVSCGTAHTRRDSGEPVTVEGPSDCTPWEAVPVPGGDAWSEVPRPRRIEVAEVYVRTTEAGTASLGYGTTGSLTWCGDYLWFTRQMDGQVMRWSPDGGLEVAFAMRDPSQVAVVSAPLCSGTTVAFTQLSDAPGPGNREVLYRADARRG